MLGVKNVGTLAHQFEDLLGSVKRGELSFSAEVSDRLYNGLKAIRQYVQEAVTGISSGINLFDIMAYMMGAPENVAPPNNGSDAENKDLECESVEDIKAGEEFEQDLIEAVEDIGTIEPIELVAQVENLEATSLPAPISHFSAPTPTHAATPAPSSYRIDTIRVETQKLDNLMTQVGELTVTKTRLDRRPSDIEQLLILWEDWSRDTFKHSAVVSELKHDHSGGLAEIQRYYQRHQARLEQLGHLLNRLQSATYEDSSRFETVTTELEENIRTLRLLPLSTIFQRFPRMVRDLARDQGKLVEFQIEGGETRADKRILEEMKDPLMHLLRNAIDHGIETPDERERLGKPRIATLRLRGYQTSTSIVIEVNDDGCGLNLESIQRTALQRGICRSEELASMSDRQIQSLIFTPGFSTRALITEVSGRGVGLDVVRTNVERLKGAIQVSSTAGAGTTFQIQLRTTLATAHVLIVRVDSISYAIPVEFVETTLLIQPANIFTIKGRDAILLANQPISVARLADLLELNATPTQALPDVRSSSAFPCIILKVGEERLGLFVDVLLDEQDVVLKPQSKLLKCVRNVSGATILGSGEVCMVLKPQDLIKSVQKSVSVVRSQNLVNVAPLKQVILLVEDSIAIRTQEKRILESAGYEIVTAVDGQDALAKLPTRQFDAIVSDVQMPNLDGLTLTATIRQHQQYSELPIILVTSLASNEDKRRGAEAGANAYIPKGTFDQTLLIETLRRLV